MPIDYYQLYRDAYALRKTNPQAATDQMLQAGCLAREAGNARAALYFEHWALQVMLNQTYDFKRAYDVAVRAAIEARRPIHNDQMERICVHEDLIGTYVGMDPIGNATLIEDALRYMAAEVTPAIQCYLCVKQCRTDFAMSIGDLDRALQETQRYLADAEDQNFEFHMGIAYKDMCEVLYRMSNWQALLDATQRGMMYIQVTESNSYIAATLAAQALAFRKLGNEQKALSAFRLATAKAATVVGSLTRPYYDMLCDFHLVEGNLRAVATLRERQIAEVLGKGQPYWEANTRLERV